MIKAIFICNCGTLLSHTTYSVPESTKEALRLIKRKRYTYICCDR